MAPMEWFEFEGRIGRKDFIIRILIIGLLFAGIFYLLQNLIPRDLDVRLYFFAKSITEFLIIVLCLPSIVKRLRDIQWPIQLGTLFIFVGIINIRNLALLGSFMDEPIFTPLPAMIVFLTIYIVSIVVLILLIFKQRV